MKVEFMLCKLWQLIRYVRRKIIKWYNDKLQIYKPMDITNAFGGYNESFFTLGSSIELQKWHNKWYENTLSFVDGNSTESKESVDAFSLHGNKISCVLLVIIIAVENNSFLPKKIHGTNFRSDTTSDMKILYHL